MRAEAAPVSHAQSTRAEPAAIESASFRDPHNRVFYADGRVFRTLSEQGLAEWEALVESGLEAELAAEGKLVRTERADGVAAAELPHALEAAAVLEHERDPVRLLPVRVVVRHAPRRRAAPARAPPARRRATGWCSRTPRPTTSSGTARGRSSPTWARSSGCARARRGPATGSSARCSSTRSSSRPGRACASSRCSAAASRASRRRRCAACSRRATASGAARSPTSSCTAGSRAATTSATST